MATDKARLGQAFSLFQQGRFADAERLFKALLAEDPRDLDAAHYFGLLKAATGDFAEAKRLIEASLASKTNRAAYTENYATILFQTQDFARAAEVCTAAMQAGGITETFQYILAISLYKTGRLQEALAAFDTLIARFPRNVAGYNEKGTVLAESGQLEAALAQVQKALAIGPSYPPALLNKGNLLAQLNRHDEAIAVFNELMRRDPNLPFVHLGLGNIYKAQNRTAEAAAAYRQALSLNPHSFEAASALVLLLESDGDIDGAFKVALDTLKINNSDSAKALAAICLRSPLLHSGMSDVRGVLTEALRDAWDSPVRLAGNGVRLLGLEPTIGGCLARFADESGPREGRSTLSPAEISAFAEDRLFRALLETTPVCDLTIELVITALRRSILAAAAAKDQSETARLEFFSAIAQQSFINNYVYFATEDEREQLERLLGAVNDSIASGKAIDPLVLVATAAYVPLHTIAGAEKLVAREWPATVRALLKQQIDEPAEEARLRATIPALTPVADDVSIKVREQYEENPYPRWIKAPRGQVHPPETVNATIRKSFPHAPFRPLPKDTNIDVLIAGCGTGQHAMYSARGYLHSRILAVDLSMASLAYAKRKIAELGLTGIDFEQADIMAIEGIEQRFDVIESVGVLHHLADPFAGWRALLSLLKPGGLMKVGLYSEAARADIVKAREFIAGGGYGSSAEDIRRCRRDIIESLPKDMTIFDTTDFYSLNGCRDLLFHVQEQRMTLPQIGEFIAANGLAFLGLVVDPRVARDYARRFPDDPAMTNLAHWHAYEIDNPRTFTGMYNFWVQKAGEPSA